MPVTIDTIDGTPGTRPVFQTGQILAASNLREEAADRIRGVQEHQAFAHLPGVLAGVWLQIDPPANALLVTPGAAVDALGRMLLVPSTGYSQALPPNTSERGANASFEVWLAFAETPADGNDPNPATGTSNRYVEGIQILFLAPGELDPADPSSDERYPIFLGTIAAGNRVNHAGRVYAGAVGARVEAASGLARLLLGPAQPLDQTIFSIGTRPSDDAAYTDHLIADAAGSITLTAPSVLSGPTPSVSAAVVAGARPFTFAAADIRDPAELVRQWAAAKNLREFLDRYAAPEPIKPCSTGLVSSSRAQTIFARVLNRAIGDDSNDTGTLENAVKDSGASLRIETRRQIIARDNLAEEFDIGLLRRLLLEDAFPGSIVRLVDLDSGGLQGLSFVGAKPNPKVAQPGSIYATDVVGTTGTQRQLRIEFQDPGSTQNPERYKVIIGAVQNVYARDDCNFSRFTPCLTVDAGKTVTIAGTLAVFAAPPSPGSTPSPGLILQITPPTDPNNPSSAGQAASQLGQVAPWDLVIHNASATLVPSTAGAKVVQLSTGQLLNTGQAPIQGVQLHAVLYSTDASAVNNDPVQATLLRDLVIAPGQVVELVDPIDPTQRLTIPLSSNDPTVPPLAADGNLSLILMAVGAGPGNVIAQDEKRIVNI